MLQSCCVVGADYLCVETVQIKGDHTLGLQQQRCGRGSCWAGTRCLLCCRFIGRQHGGSERHAATDGKCLILRVATPKGKGTGTIPVGARFPVLPQCSLQSASVLAAVCLSARCGMPQCPLQYDSVLAAVCLSARGSLVAPSFSTENPKRQFLLRAIGGGPLVKSCPASMAQPSECIEELEQSPLVLAVEQVPLVPAAESRPSGLHQRAIDVFEVLFYGATVVLALKICLADWEQDYCHLRLFLAYHSSYWEMPQFCAEQIGDEEVRPRLQR